MRSPVVSARQTPAAACLQSCWPPCPAANKDEVTCANKQVYPTCGTRGSSYPEEFANCADVRIRSGGASISPASNQAPWEEAVKINSGRAGKPQVVRMSG